MNTLAILVIGVLLLAIAVLVVYNIQVQKKIEEYKNLDERRNKLSVIQDFLNIAGEENTVDEKLKKINEISIYIWLERIWSHQAL